MMDRYESLLHWINEPAAIAAGFTRRSILEFCLVDGVAPLHGTQFERFYLEYCELNDLLPERPGRGKRRHFGILFLRWLALQLNDYDLLAALGMIKGGLFVAEETGKVDLVIQVLDSFGVEWTYQEIKVTL